MALEDSEAAVSLLKTILLLIFRDFITMTTLQNIKMSLTFQPLPFMSTITSLKKGVNSQTGSIQVLTIKTLKFVKSNPFLI